MRVLASAVLATTLCTATAAGVSEPVWYASQEGFENWMAEGGEDIRGVMSIPQVRLSVVKRVAAWARDQLKDVESMYRIYSWFGQTSGLGMVLP